MTKARLLGNLISQGQPLLDGFVTQTYVDNKITQLVNGAPGTLDTLKEIADQLATDESAVGAITTTLAGKANTSSLATVATSGSYNDLTNKPTATSGYDTITTSTGYFQIPQGTTAQRPASPANGMMRINTTLNCLEIYSTYTSAWQIVKSFNMSPSIIDLLLVGGGGTGGIVSNVRGSGGGAGGLIYIPNYPITIGSTYAITIGAGGASANGTVAAKGSDSVLSGSNATLTALGGGSGGYNDNTNNGTSGGSGGGQWYPGYTGAAATQPANTYDGLSTYNGTGWGNKGGNSGAAQPYGSGGGGAGAAGGNFDSVSGPVGGIGKQYDISGTATYYAGGGGAAGYPPYGGYAGYSGGLGGGGTGANDAYSTASNATPNTGGGGGAGGNGGSGVFILRYQDSYGPLSATTGNPNILVAGGYRIYKWTANGSFTV
jgi:hypothetical protein